MILRVDDDIIINSDYISSITVTGRLNGIVTAVDIGLIGRTEVINVSYPYAGEIWSHHTETEKPLEMLKDALKWHAKDRRKRASKSR